MKKLSIIIICILSIMFVSCGNQTDGNSEDNILSDWTIDEDRLQDESYMELHPNVDKPHQPVSYMINEMVENEDFEGLDTLRLLMSDKYEDYLDGYVVVNRQDNTAHELFCEDIQGVSSKDLIFEGTDEFYKIQSTDNLDIVRFCEKCKDEVWFYSE